MYSLIFSIKILKNYGILLLKCDLIRKATAGASFWVPFGYLPSPPQTCVVFHTDRRKQKVGECIGKARNLIPLYATCSSSSMLAMCVVIFIIGEKIYCPFVLRMSWQHVSLTTIKSNVTVCSSRGVKTDLKHSLLLHISGHITAAVLITSALSVLEEPIQPFWSLRK